MDFDFEAKNRADELVSNQFNASDPELLHAADIWGQALSIGSARTIVTHEVAQQSFTMLFPCGIAKRIASSPTFVPNLATRQRLAGFCWLSSSLSNSFSTPEKRDDCCMRDRERWKAEWPNIPRSVDRRPSTKSAQPDGLYARVEWESREVLQSLVAIEDKLPTVLTECKAEELDYMLEELEHSQVYILLSSYMLRNTVSGTNEVVETLVSDLDGFWTNLFAQVGQDREYERTILAHPRYTSK